MKKYLCKDCKQKIHPYTVKYRGGRCKSCSRKGKRNWNYKNGGIFHCIDCQKKISKNRTRCKSCAQKGELNSMYNVHRYGKDCPRYIDGRSFKPYPLRFKYIREEIRKRDNYTCQNCDLKQSELKGYHKKLCVHHIDYDKENIDPENLITLCNECNIKANSNRKYWKNYFMRLIIDKTKELIGVKL